MNLEEKLALLNNWFHDFSTDEEELRQYKKRQKFWATSEDMVLCYATFVMTQHLSNYTDFPRVVKRKGYMRASKVPLYRGTLYRSHLAQLLVDYDYHHGTGICSGIFSSRSIYAADSYARECKPMEFKLDKSAKVIDYAKLLGYQQLLLDYFVYDKKRNLREIFKRKDAEIRKNEELYPLFLELKKYAKSRSETDSKFVKAVVYEPSTIATLLGYDAINDFNTSVILNRGKMVINQKEFDRIVNGTEFYDGGVINFEQKQEKDFLRE